MPRSTSRILVGLALLASAWSRPALAGDSAEARAAAQVLFDQGKDLVKDGKFADACPKFEESQRLDPRIATQFKLADCYEHLGRTASAWTNFVDVAASTKAAGQADREQVARDRAGLLERKLSRLMIRVDPVGLAGLRVLRDGTEIGQPLWGTPVPIDPGEHRLEASAPGKKPWKSSFVVGANASTVDVTVPALVDDPAALVATPAAPRTSTAPGQPPSVAPPDSSGSGQRIAGVAVGAAGVVGIVVGSVFGARAKSRLDASRPYCRTADLCTADGLDLVSQARSAATASTVGFAVGGAALVGGLVVFFTAPSRPRQPSSSARFVPLIGPQVVGASVTGAF